MSQYIKNILCIFLILFFYYFNICKYINTWYKNSLKIKKIKKINLSKKPYKIYINDTINFYKVNSIINKINIYIEKTKINNHPITLIINSKGGEFTSGVNLITEIINKQKKNIQFECIAIHAGSISFDIFQTCNIRYVLSNTQLFQHYVALSITGSFDDFDYFFENKFKIYKNINEKLDKHVATKIGISYTDYKNKIKNTWILNNGKDIIKNKLADKIVQLV